MNIAVYGLSGRRVVTPETDSSATEGARDRAKRADAVRNIEAIVDAATRLLAVAPDVSG